MIPLLVSLVLQGKPVHPAQASIPVSDASVTAREAREAFARYGKLIQKVNGFPLGTPGIPENELPVTRAQVVAEMARFYGVAGPTFRFIPAAVPFDAKKLRIERSQLPSLTNLVRRGFIGRVSPLAVGPSSSLTPKQFGDALGFFASRIVQMSHLPSPTFTPFLQGD